MKYGAGCEVVIVVVPVDRETRQTSALSLYEHSPRPVMAEHSIVVLRIPIVVEKVFWW